MFLEGGSGGAAAAAAAAAKSLQSCPTLCDPIDGSPLGSPVPGKWWEGAFKKYSKVKATFKTFFL